eukprot:CAMPEP_0172553270 /NCGR_PEP_ID=MMETSP1067-20121228/49787_1 /TAXON_ID=265564 ORGANISM="Thalassiosira punctigera, Strain Tpunct2005C2" /NCGR_SAMPLE_ID=MMETSP1067 /ASSEMBLY_ACC=CAM_ASM_000444 /LENGTH=207 /DNA_ID=CAMNT_0013341429 /DNA_START=3 /DNA_END=627 /DNA_ORIENTATION=-
MDHTSEDDHQRQVNGGNTLVACVLQVETIAARSRRRLPLWLDDMLAKMESNGGGGRNGNGGSKSGHPTQQPSTSPSSAKVETTTFLQRFLAPKPMPPRNTPRWYAEMALICTVFGITGSSTMFLVRPAVSDGLGLKGSMKEGPWSYRICSLVIMTPMYATLLVIVGTVFGRHAYFRHFSVKMFSRFGVPPELMDRNFHVNAKNFRKW